jgi:peptidoglycan/LPS O-acetylase OafA/YrhL
MIATLPSPELSILNSNRPAETCNLPIARLRAFLVALVVAHHAVLAYYPWLPPPGSSLVTQPRLWQAFPTLDPRRWTGWATFVGFNDTFFMALMFFVSGLFVWNSLQRKGTGQFLRDRLLRLGLPFVISVVAIAPLAYYPAYLQTTATPSIAGFWQQWRALGNWPSGPAWFLWVLLAFGCAAAALHALAPRCMEPVARSMSGVLRRPFALFAVLVALSAIAYIPMAMAFNPLTWSAWGPFAFQTSRIFHYAIYFGAGAIIGACGGEQSVPSSAGPLAKRWILWLSFAALSFAVNSAIAIAALTNPAHPRSVDIINDFAFTITCAASSFAFLSLFLRFVKSRGPIVDSLCACSYGIYLVHYPIVNWLQHALLSFPVSAFLKGLCVTLAGLALSWALISVLRRSRSFARIV